MTDALPPVDELLGRMADALRRRIAARDGESPRLVGIHTGGVWVARRLHAMLGLDVPLGTLDISFHRDDYSDAGLNPLVRPSALPWDVGTRDVVLVDDVLYTGRTVRAAINEIFDWGRPRSVALAVLVVRDGRELPIEADVAGAHVVLEPGESIKLRGPEPLRLERIASP